MISSLKRSQSDSPPPLQSNSLTEVPPLRDEANDGRPRSLASSIIGSELTISCNLVTKGQVQIDGEIEGDVHGIYVLVSWPRRSSCVGV
jgi:hypothetical protein